MKLRIIRDCDEQQDARGWLNASCTLGLLAEIAFGDFSGQRDRPRAKGVAFARYAGEALGRFQQTPGSNALVITARYQTPTFCMDFQGSAGSSLVPFCSSSMEMLSGERTKAIHPSLGGRLMVTP